ncbi:unnamed protein product [Linum trigynum]|uniref:CCHC-type domain-containing protein n=1 Tax=Linum trigynum TaxID=586398 RepID=A0AAV2E5H5_9ROSI
MQTKTPPKINQLFEDLAEKGYDRGATKRTRKVQGHDVHVVETQSSSLVDVISKLVTAIDRNRMVIDTGQPHVMYCQWCKSTNHMAEDC